MVSMDAFRSIEWTEGKLRLLDQRQLPTETTYRDYISYIDVASAIRSMVVRGAPAIGVTAAFGLALGGQQSEASTLAAFLDDLQIAGEHLIAARPTAVNLSWAVAHLFGLADRKSVG